MKKETFIAKTAIVYPHVKIGQGARIEDYCIVGAPLADGSEPETIIGAHCHLRAMTIIYAGNHIGDHFQTGNKANIRENNRIGNRVSIGTLSVVEHSVIIDDDVRIHTGAFIPEYSRLEKGSWVGPHVVLTNAKIPLHPEAKKSLKGPTLKPRAIVGANSTLSPGVEIGEGALVGSGSNVTKNVEAESVYFNPQNVSQNPRAPLKSSKG
jgi:acetyltransferase-like isoleucine patch superfamily enzyme